MIDSNRPTRYSVSFWGMAKPDRWYPGKHYEAGHDPDCTFKVPHIHGSQNPWPQRAPGVEQAVFRDEAQ